MKGEGRTASGPGKAVYVSDAPSLRGSRGLHSPVAQDKIKCTDWEGKRVEKKAGDKPN